jgi:DNA modification methylase
MSAIPEHFGGLSALLTELEDPQTDLPRIAKDERCMRDIEARAGQLSTTHRLINRDAREMSNIKDQSVHLIVTSPPYWTLKKYNDHEHQLGGVGAYEEFLSELDKVWMNCFRVLIPGGRLICVVGDVCLSRRKNKGRHMVVPQHASIQEHCRSLGYDNLTPIIWHKIANAVFEASGNGAGFLGKPYEPNAVIKNDIEYILMERKPGGYRKPSLETRVLSLISDQNHKKWFRSIWSGLTGASTRSHPAPFPEELAERLIRMYSFAGDTVLDPFLGTGTTAVAASNWGRNSIGIEVDPNYFDIASRRLHAATGSLFSQTEVVVEK